MIEDVIHLCFKQMSLEEVGSQDCGRHPSLETCQFSIPIALHHVWHFRSLCANMLIQVVGGCVLLGSKTRQSHNLSDLFFAEFHLLHENTMAFQAWVRRGRKDNVNAIKHPLEGRSFLIVHFHDLMSSELLQEIASVATTACSHEHILLGLKQTCN